MNNLNYISFATVNEDDNNENEQQAKEGGDAEVDTLKIEKEIKMNVKAFLNLKASRIKRQTTSNLIKTKVSLKPSIGEDDNVR